MKFTAGQIADFLEAKIEGNSEILVSTVSKIEEGTPGSLSFLANPKYTRYIYDTKASVVIVNQDFIPEKPLQCTLIKVPDAYSAFAKLLQLYETQKEVKSGLAQSAVIAPDTKFGEDVYIGENVCIEKGCKIGNNTKIYPNSYLGSNVSIGDNTTLMPGVTIYDNSVIGNNVMLHAGVVVGSDGFGFAPRTEEAFMKVPQIGNVIIEDDVEIGANTTIDKATLGSTIIRKGVKLDNLIQVAHNVEIGENTVIAAQTGIAGSTKIGKNCMIGGQVGFVGHLTVGNHVKIGAQAGIHRNLKDNETVQGTPAVNYRQWYRISALLNQLPEMKKQLDSLTKS